jgi:hypothetical protein
VKIEETYKAFSADGSINSVYPIAITDKRANSRTIRRSFEHSVRLVALDGKHKKILQVLLDDGSTQNIDLREKFH